ncbi:MAG: DUF2073 domain-containing protein [Nanoarchaeota archaeon]
MMKMDKKELKKLKGLSLHVMPFSEVKSMTISERVRKILNLVLNNKIVILHGRLRPEEEARLIEDTMALVDHVKGFTGIELAVIEPQLKNESVFIKMKHGIAKKLVGDNSSLTVIGPASVIKEIKRDPRKIELMLS